MSCKILVCEDEENIVSFLKAELEYEGFETDVAYDGNEAMRLFAESESPAEGSEAGGISYALVLLDIMLPEKNGLECLREIRKTSKVPVIILTARKEVYDKVAFLTAGADDYVTKPFDTMELIARIKRHIQRGQESAQPWLAPPQSPESRQPLLSVNKDGRRAEISGQALSLTNTEFEILSFLYENRGKVKTRDEIISAALGEFYGESNVIDTNIKNIRAKIARFTQAQIIETVRGRGYVIRNE
ncbi:MAG: response regulator transcription factor [Defluviitaleaceae bacterium]|nr:response regulator transcription factor [Defluviitaleaceae bacterium]